MTSFPRLPFLHPYLRQHAGHQSAVRSHLYQLYRRRLETTSPNQRQAFRSKNYSTSSSSLFRRTPRTIAAESPLLSPKTCWRLQSTSTQRYGSAAVPMPIPKPDDASAGGPPEQQQQEQKQQEQQQNLKTEGKGREASKNGKVVEAGFRLSNQKDASPNASERGNESIARSTESSRLTEVSEELEALAQADSKPLDRVLQMPPPTAIRKGETPDALASSSSSSSVTGDVSTPSTVPTNTDPERVQKHPHLEAPPYVHHFDTYTLVRQLVDEGSFTEAQGVTLMKAIRSIMAVNLSTADEALVSKSDVANESYLFRAACSELRTELEGTRRAATEKMRSERAILQHELDILSHRVGQESLTLKDDLRGLLDDRKMSARMDARARESRIQELNYRITVEITGDARGEVEALRWFLTRRAAMFIAAMAILILGSLRYATYMTHVQEQERARMAKSKSSSSGASDGLGKDGGDRGLGSGEGGGSGRYTIPSRDAGTQTAQTDAMLASMDSGAKSPSYVSLG